MKITDLDKDTIKNLHLQLSKYSSEVGGKFCFLQMLEDIRSIKHPLLKTSNSLYYDTGKVLWNKTIFQDKLDLLIQTMRKIEIDKDMFKDINDYKKKKVINMLKALKPINFKVIPNNTELNGFEFNLISQNNEISLIFKIIFFYNIGFAKDILNYKISL